MAAGARPAGDRCRGHCPRTIIFALKEERPRAAVFGAGRWRTFQRVGKCLPVQLVTRESTNAFTPQTKKNPRSRMYAVLLGCLASAVAFSVPHAFVGTPQRRHLRTAVRAQMPEPRILTEENAKQVLDECMQELGTLFGSNAESRGVGITGEIEFVDLDGPTLVVQLKGAPRHAALNVIQQTVTACSESVSQGAFGTSGRT